MAAVLVLLLAACGGMQKPTRLANGSWKIQCLDHLDRCVRQVSSVCGDRDYEILGGGKTTTVYGGATGEQTATEQHTLIVRCARPGQSLAEESEAHGEPEAPPEPKAAAEPKAAGEPEPESTPKAPVRAQEQPSPARVCAPGSTQRCVGPGACEGGQSCAADGSGYLPCDCGDGTGGGSTAAPPARGKHP